MPVGFDNIAATYDDGFVNTITGRMQRNIVWNYLDKCISRNKSLDILELNCGTGEDALWISSKGHNVLATDISEKMVKAAKAKALLKNVGDKLSFTTLDIANPSSYPNDKKFDLIFSNFGGLNCISPGKLVDIMPHIAGLINPGGKFIAVIMPKFCLWEWLYFSFKGRYSDAVRRSGIMPLSVNIEGNTVDTWYFSPSEIANTFSQEFKTINTFPLGFFLPPSYLENYFKKHTGLIGFLNVLEKLVNSISTLSSYSDHFIIEMEVKS